jgi:protein-disulfide isomerase
MAEARRVAFPPASITDTENDDMASSTKDTKAAASAARARAAELKAKERRAQSRIRFLIVLGVLVAAVLFGFAVKYIAGSGGGQVYDSGKLTTPSAADASGGILVNQDGTTGGTPPEGSVRVDVYFDPLCPGCKQLDSIEQETFTAMRQEGTIAVYYHPLAILNRLSVGTKYSTRASAALATVAQYDGTHLEAFIAALFANQPAENTSGLSNAKLVEIANGIGVPEDVTARFADGEFTRWVTAATEQASVDGLQSTPWVRIEQKTEMDPGIWSNPENMKTVLQYIHDFGLQKYLDSVAAAQASLATPSPTATP